MKRWLTIAWFVLHLAGVLSAQEIPKSAYVINSVANTLSVINLENDQVLVDTLSPGAGSIPNFMVLRDGKGYVVNSGTNDIMVFDLATLQKIKTIQLPNDSNPWAMDFVNDSVAVVTLWLTNQIAVVNVNSGELLQTVPVGSSPEGIKMVNGKVYVANTGYVDWTLPYEPGTVMVIDTSDFQVVDTIGVGTNPQDLDADSQGRLLVACTGNYGAIGGELDLIDTAADTLLDSVKVGAFITTVRVNNLGKVYLATYGYGVLVYDLNSASFERDAANPLAGGPGVAFYAANNAYIVEFGDGSSASILRVFSPGHTELKSYTVNVGAIFVVVYDSATTALENRLAALPGQFRLEQNYPNPFNPSTTIEFTLPERANVTLEVFNLLGQLVRTLHLGVLNAGVHRIQWDGRDEAGNPAPSGIYFYRLRSGERVQVRKMQLLR